MSYDEEQQKRSRVVVETPTARREVVQQETVRYPQERRGYSTGMVATVALLAIAATAIIFLFLTNSRNDSTEANVNLRATTTATQPTPLAPPVIVQQQPLTQPTPIIIQQAPPMTTSPAPVIIQQAPPATTTAPPPTTSAPPASGRDDASLQQKIDKAFADDSDISAATVTATVIDGKVMLSGTVNSEAVKQRAARLASAVKGVLGVDNKIIVSPSTP
jgi:hypothetical protein